MANRRGVLPLALLAWLVVGAAGVAPAPADDAEAAGLEDAVAWLDAKGFPPPASRPFVRVFTGAWVEDEEGRRTATPTYGLLVEDDGPRFEVLTTTLQTLELEPTGEDVPPAERVAWEEADLAAHADEVAASWTPAADGYDNDGFLRVWSTRMDRQGEALVVAWMAWGQGHEEAAARVWKAAQALEPEKPLLPEAKAQVELALWWRIVDAFGDAGVTWTRLLADVTDYLRRFPESSLAETARRARATLVRTATGPDVAEPPADAPAAERAAWLVDRLVTQNGQQPGQPGRCDVFLDPRGDDSPAHRLLALGYDAVPALIAALDDMRFTRSVGYVRDFTFSHHVLRVSDVALDVLESIAGQSFWRPPYFSEHLSQEKEEVRAPIRQAVETWWQEAEAKGEEAMLAGAVEGGDERAAYLAARLVEKYPSQALPALRAGLEAAETAEERGYLAQAVAKLDAPEARDLLRKLLLEDPSLLVRATVAFALLPRDPDLAIEAMAAAWRDAPRVEGTFWTDDETDMVLGFLVGCGDVRGIEAIRARMEVCGVPWRVGAIAALASGGWHLRMPYALKAPQPGSEVERAPREVLAAAESLLLERLGDRTPVLLPVGMSSSFHDRFVLPAIGDYAAWALGEIFPDRFGPAFDPSAALDVRDAWIAGVLERAGRPVPPPRVEAPPGADADPERAHRVTRVLLEGGSEVPGDLAAVAGGLQGTVLTPEAWLRVLLAAVEAVAPGGRSVRLRLERPSAASGIRIEVRLEPRDAPSEENASLGYGWRYRVGPRGVAGGGGSGALSYLHEAASWSDHVEAMRELLASPPDAILVAEVSMSCP